MKKSYEHHYDKVTVPCFADLYEVAEFMTEDDYEMVKGSIEKVGFTVTVEHEKGDPSCGDPESYRILDWDCQPFGVELVLFADIIRKAVEGFVFTYEEDIIESEAVRNAFDYFNNARELALENASMEKYYNVVSR